MAMVDKRYVDCAAQTDTPARVSTGVQIDTELDTFLTSPHRTIAAVDIRGEPTTLSELILSPRSRHCTTSSHDHDAYSQQSIVNDSEDLEGDSVNIETTTREFNISPQPRRFPRDVALRSISTRIVSLPETAPIFSARKALERVKMRVVSQPDRLKPTVFPDTLTPFSDHLDIAGDALNPFVFESHRRSRVRVRSDATDLPHTPSLPSSPESVLIIADKSQLPKGFLNNALNMEDFSIRADEGWVTWARSPPKPIPALHGPLSLPYARCPSGAEGTIIDEQENLPRIIWGLEGEENSHRLQPDPVSRSADASTPREVVPQASQGQIPPRFQRADDTQDQSKRVSTAANGPTRLDYPQANIECNQKTVHKPQCHADIDLSLPGHGPIDLSNILRPRIQVAERYSKRLDIQECRPNLDSYTFENDRDVGWQDTLSMQDQFQSQPLPSSSSFVTDLSDYLTPSVSSSSVSSLQSLVSSRSPIVLDSLGRPQHVSHLHQTSRRMSALEIAQNYRQQQLTQQAMLPTPPSSSSPLWSSRFSPYQGSLVSPDLLALPGLHSAVLNKHGTLRVSQHAQQADIHIHSHDASSGVGTDDTRSQADVSLAPSTHIQDSFVAIHDLPGSTYLHGATSEPSAHYLRVHYGSSSALAPAMSMLRSPAPPGPPPNTPMAALSSATSHQHDGGHISFIPITAAPPSPTSPPSLRLRSGSHQQSRPAPLSQLLSRRLSSVPEEDLNVYTTSVSSLAPKHSPDRRSRNIFSGGTLKGAILSGRDSQPKQLPNTFAPSISKGASSRVDRNQAVGTQHYLEYSRPTAGPERAHKINRLPWCQPVNASGHGSSEDANHDEGIRGKDIVGRSGGSRNTRGNKLKGNGRGRRGRNAYTPSRAMNGPERVDGGITVRS